MQKLLLILTDGNKKDIFYINKTTLRKKHTPVPSSYQSGRFLAHSSLPVFYNSSIFSFLQSENICSHTHSKINRSISNF